MPYSPKDFGDVAEKATMAPSELQPPLNFADGGAVNWAGDSTVYNTQSQIGNMMATPGGFGSMASQFTTSAPFASDQNPFSGYQDPNQMQDQSQEQGYDFNLGTILQPMPSVPPPPAPTVGSFSSDAFNSITPPLSGGNTMPPMDAAPEATMAKGGDVSGLINRLKGEFSKRGLDFDRVMAQRLASKGQKGDTMLAHINPDEARMLKQAGGSGKINPNTGLPSFSGAEDDGGSETSSNYDGGGLDRGYYSDDTDYSSDPDYGSYGARGPITSSSQSSGYSPPDRDVFGERSTTSPSSARAAEDASMKAYNDIMGTSPTALMSDSMLRALSNANAANAIAVYNQDVRNAGLPQSQMRSVGPFGVDPIDEAMNSPLSKIAVAPIETPAQKAAREADLAENQAQKAIDAFGLRTGIPTGIPTPDIPAAPVVAETAKNPFGAYTQATRPAGVVSPFEAAVNSVVANANPPMPTPRPTDLGVTTAPLTVASTPKPPVTPVTPVDLPASTVPPAVVPLPVPRPPAEIPPAAAAEETPPQKDMFGNIISPKNVTNAFVSMFPGIGLVNTAAGLMGGQTMGDIVAKSGQPYATTSEINEMYENATPAPGVPLPPIPYRDMGEGNFLDNILKPFGLDTESTVAKMAKPYLDQGMSESEAYTRASYDLRAQQMKSMEGTGRGGQEYIPKRPYYRPPVTPPAPETPTTPVAPVWSRTYSPTGVDYSRYGYGPEGTFYTYAKGGPTGPLSKARK